MTDSTVNTVNISLVVQKDVVFVFRRFPYQFVVTTELSSIKCSECGKLFKRAGWLKRHMERVHSSVKTTHNSSQLTHTDDDIVHVTSKHQHNKQTAVSSHHAVVLSKLKTDHTFAAEIEQKSSHHVRLQPNFNAKSSSRCGNPLAVPSASLHSEQIAIQPVRDVSAIENRKEQQSSMPQSSATQSSTDLFCPYCGKSFKKLGWLNRHIDRIHGQETSSRKLPAQKLLSKPQNSKLMCDTPAILCEDCRLSPISFSFPSQSHTTDCTDSKYKKQKIIRDKPSRATAISPSDTSNHWHQALSDHQRLQFSNNTQESTAKEKGCEYVCEVQNRHGYGED